MNKREFVIAVVSAGPILSSAQQQGKVWHIGYLSSVSAVSSSRNTNAFLQGLRDLGYVEGKNLVIEWRFADGKLERLPALAADLVRLKVDLIVAAASPSIGAAQQATKTIPIVMTTTGDPVGSGFVKSLAHPGGNLNGDLGPKLFDLLHSVIPELHRVAVLVTPTSATYREISEDVQASAQRAGVKTLIFQASSAQDVDDAFTSMARENVDAVIVGASSFLTQQRNQIGELVNRYRMPSIFGNAANVEAGGLMSYGYRVTDNYQRAATYVDRVLKGAKPGDMPVEQPTKLELVVNVNAAKALGLTIPQLILLRADKVIQ
jgi:putative ABC transport system substrate-binding protein